MSFHDLFGKFWGRNYDGGDFTELQVHERAILLGQVCQDPMGQSTSQMVHAANDWKFRGSWWKIWRWFSPGFQDDEKEEQKCYK